MNGIWLDFERPIVDLEKKIEELKGLKGVEAEIKRLKSQAERLKKRIYSNLSRWQRVQLARHPRRPQPLDIMKSITEDFLELHGDRRFGDDKAIVAGIAKLDAYNIALIGHQKGRDTKEKLKRNFGLPHPEGHRKALRVMKMAAKFNMPVVTLVDSAGAYPGAGAEERGQAESISTNLFECATLPTPVIVLILGEGMSGGALAIAVGDRILMLENAIYSVITPEGCASILWRDSSKNKEAAEALKITAHDLSEMNVIDEIVPEPIGGAHMDVELTAKNIKKALLKNLKELTEIPIDKLLDSRIQKFRNIGAYKK
jgi:acetyl-CoA carboxylase carboxyl transferase subunit alpha